LTTPPDENANQLGTSLEPWMVTIDPTRCKGDGLCVETCLAQVIELHGGIGAKKAVPVRPHDCTGCKCCLVVCENNAIELIKG
jgi:2-oxoglutarate ferredoxin oxidoreductase subunit delta